MGTGQLLCRALSPYAHLLKTVHVNAQSISAHIDDMRVIFDSNVCHVILVSESWLKPHITSQAVNIPGYNLFRNDRLHAVGGGVAAYVKSNINIRILHCSDTSIPARPEYMFLEASYRSIKVLIGLCYRPPNIGFLNEFEDTLQYLMARYVHVVVMGDFNADLLGLERYEQTFVRNMFMSCNMSILPLNATHHSNTTDTWLDLIAVSDDTQVVHHGQLPAFALSRHDLIFCVHKFKFPKPKPKLISYRDYNAIDLQNLISDANNLRWDLLYIDRDVNYMWSVFQQIILNLFEKHVPLVTKRVSRRPIPWLTPEIRVLMKQRDSVYRRARKSRNPEDVICYKRIRNRVKQDLRNAKTRYIYSSLANHKTTSEKWKFLKNLGINSDTSSRLLCSSLDLNELNDYFTNIPVDSTGAEVFFRNLSDTNPGFHHDGVFSFGAVTEQDVLRAVFSIKSNAVGADSISLRFIKDIIIVVLPHLTAIFNKSLITNTFPSAWKSAIVVPLPKMASATLPSDYRPISILSALSKCLERLVHEQISSYLSQFNLLSPFQSGFRRLHSTTTALLCITDDIRAAMDKGNLTLLTLFDFSKAFDCVYHPLLLFKLRKFGFSPGCVAWFRSYLTDRRQCVKLLEECSDWRHVSRGVPQGSVLGPLLFCLYINDITSVIRFSKCHLYADDLQIYSHFKAGSMEDCVLGVNVDVGSVSSWAYDNGLKLNDAKTQTMVVGHVRQLNRIDLLSAPKIAVNGTFLEYSHKVKNLGLIMDDTLSWKDYVLDTCRRVYFSIHSLKMFDHYLPFNVKVLLVKTLTFPHFNYCDVVVNDMSRELSERMQRAQNYCIRFLFKCRRDEHITPFYRNLSILKLNNMRSIHVLLQLFKIIKSGQPNYLAIRFKFLSSISMRRTRQGSTLLSIPVHRTAIFNKSFTVSSCRLWNSLPSEIRDLGSRTRFGVALRELMSAESWGLEG